MLISNLSEVSGIYIGSTEIMKMYYGSQLVFEKQTGLPVGTTYNFSYTGDVQSKTLPAGRYKLQCWGAQGGSVSGDYTATGSKGGYSEGVLVLTEETTLYIFVGGSGTSTSTSTSSSILNGGWNGGGGAIDYTYYSSSGTLGKSYPRPGGGATDIALVTSDMSYSSYRNARSEESLLSRIIVAGGGAGASARYTEETTTDTTTEYQWNLKENRNVASYYKFGSGYYGWYGVGYDIDSNIKYKIANITTPSGASSINYISIMWYGDNLSTALSGEINISENQELTPLSGADSYKLWVRTSATSTEGFETSPTYYDLMQYTEVTVLGGTSTQTSSGRSNASQQGGGTSGKGQYPGTLSSAGSGGVFGFGANQTTNNYRYAAGGGGGGWYGGGSAYSDSSTSYVNYSGGGSGFVNISSNSSYRPSGYSGLELESGSTIAGDSSFESTSGGTETGHAGDGYARITVLSSDGSSGGNTSTGISWDVQTGSWNQTSNSSAIDGISYTSVSPGDNGSTVIRCTLTNIETITFAVRNQGETGYDYLTIGNLDSSCTRDSYNTSCKNSSSWTNLTFEPGEGTHYVEFCYSKDSSVSTDPDAAEVYVVSYTSIPQYSINWAVQSGTWTESSNSSAKDNKQWTCTSPGTSGSTVIRCTFSGLTSITFDCRSQGESGYDYLTVGSLDSSCTRSTYSSKLSSSTSYTSKTYTCTNSQHYVEFCYSKDGSVDTSPDNADVYISNYTIG